MENENDLKFWLGIKIWCIISIIGSSLSALVSLYFGFYSVATICTGTVILYVWLLLSKKRITFYLILFVAIVRIIIGLIILKEPKLILGSGNSLITYAFLYKYWKQMKQLCIARTLLFCSKGTCFWIKSQFCGFTAIKNYHHTDSR